MIPLRFRVRTLMVLVAVVACALALVILRHRMERFENAATFYAGEEWSEGVREQWYTMNGLPAEDIQRARSRKAHFARLKAKYTYAARHPWISVAPDPPPPTPGP